jgi:tRNA 2-thiouridine synthesizing protein E
MVETQALNSQSLDNDGFLNEITGWNRDMAMELARRNDLGPLTEKHWKIIDYVRDYYKKHGEGPPIVKIGKATGYSSGEICKMFPCGVARGAYRLAGLPRPSGCV